MQASLISKVKISQIMKELVKRQLEEPNEKGKVSPECMEVLNLKLQCMLLWTRVWADRGM